MGCWWIRLFAGNPLKFGCDCAAIDDLKNLCASRRLERNRELLRCAELIISNVISGISESREARKGTLSTTQEYLLHVDIYGEFCSYHSAIPI
jgi:hypothetical protein